MSLVSVITDLQNVEHWDDAQRARRPDIWLLGGSTTARDMETLPGLHWLHFQPGVLYNDWGTPAGEYNSLLNTIVAEHGAQTLFNLTPEAPATPLYMIDFSKASLADGLAGMILQRYPRLNGLNCDYWGKLSWLFGARTPTGEAPEVYWPKYANGLAGFLFRLRHARRGFQITGQCDVLSDDWSLNTAIDGLKLEQFPTFNGRSLVFHAMQKELLDARLAKLGRKSSFWQMELRYPSVLGEPYCANAIAWAEKNGLALSYGLGAQASVYVE